MTMLESAYFKMLDYTSGKTDIMAVGTQDDACEDGDSDAQPHLTTP